ncbi:MAG: ABC transporter permease [Gemmatimonas sp.]
MKIFNEREGRNDELDAEIAGHLALAERHFVAQGLSREDARAAALREFGNVTHIKQTTREMWGGKWFDELRHDVRYAARSLSRAKTFSLTAISTLALGIAAATVIFSVADHVVLRPLRYPDADRLFVITERINEMRAEYPSIPANASHFLEWQRLCTECEDVAAMRQGGLTYAGVGDAEQIGTVRATWNMLPLLGAHTALGRLFNANDDTEAGANVVLLSYAYWQRKFGSDSSIVGRGIPTFSGPRQVIGILAPEFKPPKGGEMGSLAKLPDNVEIIVPLGLTQMERTTPGSFDYTVIAKLKSGATLAQAQARIAALQTDISSRRPDKVTIEAFAAPLQQVIVGTSGNALWILLAAVATILLIACVNLTNLSLARQAARTREAAVRIALGANQGRLIRQALTESLLISLIGGAFGMLISRWGLQLLLYFAPSDFPRLAEVTLDMRIFAAAMVVSVLTGLLFGAMPAFRYGRVAPSQVLKAGGRSSTEGRHSLSARAVLVASQMALSATLLYTTALFVVSFIRVIQIDKGFHEERVLAFDLSLPRGFYAYPQERINFYDEVLSKLSAIPGVRATGFTSMLPLEGENEVNALSRQNDQRPSAERPMANVRRIDGGYFSALGIKANRGRLPDHQDRTRRVVVLSDRAASLLWPGEDPIGKWMNPGEDSLAEVIGTVPDSRTSGIEKEGSLIAYIPYWQKTPLEATLLIGTSADPILLSKTVRDVVRDVGKLVPVSNIRTIEQVVSKALAPRRFQLVLLVLFAGSAIVIASIGTYGVISHSLLRRSNEIGVRMALGAEPGSIHRLVLLETLSPVVCGLLVGVACSLGMSGVFRALLYDVRPLNFPALASVIAILVTVAVVACLIPARRSTQGGALSALRAD